MFYAYFLAFLNTIKYIIKALNLNKKYQILLHVVYGTLTGSLYARERSIIVVSVTSGGSDAPMALQLANWDSMATLLGLAGFLAALALFVQRVLRK